MDTAATVTPTTLAAEAFESGKAAVLFTTAQTILDGFPRRVGAPVALALADRLYTRGSTDKALTIVGNAGFCIPGIKNELTLEIITGMMQIFNRGAARNDIRMLAAGGLFILSGGCRSFPALTAPVLRTLVDKADLELAHGNHDKAAGLAVVAQVGTSEAPVADVTNLLREIARQAYQQGDFHSSAAAAYYMANSASPRDARDEAAWLSIDAARKYPAEHGYHKGKRTGSKLEWGANHILNTFDLLSGLPKLKVEAVEGMRELQQRAFAYGHAAAVRNIGARIATTVTELRDGSHEQGLRPIGKTWHRQLNTAVKVSEALIAGIGKRGLPRSKESNGGAPML